MMLGVIRNVYVGRAQGRVGRAGARRTQRAAGRCRTRSNNFLANLSFRSEQTDFDVQDQGWDRCMDDLILRTAVWQSEHWRSADSTGEISNASKVTLVSFDRNRECPPLSHVLRMLANLGLDRTVRLKARSRGVDAANEQDLASILATGT